MEGKKKILKELIESAEREQQKLSEKDREAVDELFKNDDFFWKLIIE